MTNEDHVKSLIATIIKEFGQLDMAVNNAGISSEVVSIDASNSDNYSAMVNTNLVDLYYCMKHQIIQMLKQKQGAIVNVASVAGLNGIPWAATYASTKHGVVGLTKSAAILIMRSKVFVLTRQPLALSELILLTNNLMAMMKIIMKK